jgi:hypothetical protein
MDKIFLYEQLKCLELKIFFKEMNIDDILKEIKKITNSIIDEACPNEKK